MEEIRQYSLADHTLSIVNSTRSLTIGNGSALDSFSVQFENDNFSFTMSADGSATLNKNYMKNGSISISLQQTNPFVNSLIDFYKSQGLTGVTDTANIVIKDANGNINGRFEKCVITKYPDYTAGQTSAVREFTIIYGKGVLD